MPAAVSSRSCFIFSIVLAKTSISPRSLPKAPRQIPRARPYLPAQPQALQPQALQPQALQPQALQPQALQPQALQPQALEPQALQPQALQPQALQPQPLRLRHPGLQARVRRPASVRARGVRLLSRRSVRPQSLPRPAPPRRSAAAAGRWPKPPLRLGPALSHRL